MLSAQFYSVLKISFQFFHILIAVVGNCLGTFYNHPFQSAVIKANFRRLTCEHNIHQNTYCVNIGSFIGLINSVLLGCGISHCANSLCVFRLIGLVQPCRIKINQLYITVAVNHHIFRLNILVYNLVRM